MKTSIEVRGIRACKVRIVEGYYKGKCPFCNTEFAGDDYEKVKRRLRDHMIENHYDELIIRLKRAKGEKSLKWLAGLLAGFSIKEDP